MKRIFLLLLITVSVSAKAQYTFISDGYIQYDPSTGPGQRIDYKQMFNISFTDKLLIHNVFSEESFSSIDVSQVYRIIDNYYKNGVYFFTAQSGVTGNLFYYGIRTDEDNAAVFQYDEKGGSSYFKYYGQITTLKTFKQE